MKALNQVLFCATSLGSGVNRTCVKSSPEGSEKSAPVQLFSVCHSGKRHSVTRFHGDGVTIAGALPKQLSANE